MRCTTLPRGLHQTAMAELVGEIAADGGDVETETALGPKFGMIV